MLAGTPLRHLNLSPHPKQKNPDDLKKHEDIYLVPVLFFDDTSFGVYALYIHTNFKNTHTHTHTHNLNTCIQVSSISTAAGLKAHIRRTEIKRTQHKCIRQLALSATLVFRQ